MANPKEILSGYGLNPKKSLGQNFLSDDSLLDEIVQASNLAEGDEVLEIGPGLGDLTRKLASVSKRVVAVEIDDRILPILKERLVGFPNIEVEHADILEFDTAEKFDSGYKVVGNLPYYITGAIFRKILALEDKPELVVFTIQDEVAERITAEPGNMSLLGVMVQYYASVQKVRKIKAGSFWPKPEVDSALVQLIIRDPLPLKDSDEANFFRLVRIGFSQKRKQLQKNLRQLGITRTDLSNTLAGVDIDGARRAQTLSIDEWISLFGALNQHIPPA